MSSKMESRPQESEAAQANGSAAAVGSWTMPPGPRTPRLYQAVRLISRPYQFALGGHERYGDQFTIKIPGGWNYFVVGDPELAKQVMAEPREVLSRGQPPIARPMFGSYSLFMLEGEEHAAHRRLIEPPFRGERLRSYDEITMGICDEELEKLPLNEPVSLIDALRRITLKTIVAATFGAFDHPGPVAVAKRTEDAIAYSYHLINLGRVWLSGMKGWKLPKGFVAMRDPLDAAIYAEIKRAQDDPNLSERGDILADLVRARRDDGSPMSDQEIRDEVVTMMIQGHGSTASSVGWAIERLSRHPPELDRLRSSLKEGDKTYLNAVVKETLRVRPPLSMPTRKVVRPYKLGGYNLKPDTLIMLDMIKLHRHPSMYPDPERFDPERFMGDAAEGKDWMPFGGGVWGCPGAGLALQELKGILPAIVTKLRWEPDEWRDEEPLRRGFNLEPKRGVRVIIRERVSADGE
jgi:cytochrome P450 family 135